MQYTYSLALDALTKTRQLILATVVNYSRKMFFIGHEMGRIGCMHGYYTYTLA